MNFHRPNFRPRNRGDISKALATPTALSVIAPESPRPLELLLGVTYDRESTLTSDDAALHELLMTVALHEDVALESDVHAVPMRNVLRYLGPEARRDAVKDSLARLLKNTVSFGTYEQVPLLVAWIERKDADDLVHFALPAPIKTALAGKSEYACVELAALKMMRSKHVQRLYKALVAELRMTGRQWILNGNNTVTISASPAQVADWVCFPRAVDGGLRVGKLKERVLDIAVAQFSDVQAFRLQVGPVSAKTRGNPIIEVRFELTLNPPSHHQTRAIFDASGIKQFGGIDAPEFRVRQDIWLKASGHFVANFPDLAHGVLFQLWAACLKEMLEEEPISDGYATRRYRGESLRQELAKRGPDQTAWAWAMEEAENPDLVLRSKQERKELAAVGEAARRERVWGENAKPVIVPAPAQAVIEEVLSAPPAVRFQDCSEVWIDLDDTMTIGEVDNIFLDEIVSYSEVSGWRGDAVKIIKVRWWIRGDYDYHDFKRYSPSEDDIETIRRRLGKFIERVEYKA